MLQSGDIISGMYQVIREIGTGGMGVIYIGYHLHLQKQIVIKKIKETCVDRVNVRGEADILKQLRHTYLPQVYDFLEVGNDVYTVMDYIPGENLQYYIDHNYTFPEETILLWMRELCEVLDYLHTRKPRILHSDIKPANIMVTPEGDICLIDFNISLDGSVTQEVQGLSRRYASPEQFRCAMDKMYGRKSSETLDERMDIYSLGAVFYRMMSGYLPDAQNGVPYALSQIDIPYADGLKRIVDKAMDRDVSRRFRTAKQMEEALSHMEKYDPKYRRLTNLQILTATAWGFCILAGIFLIASGVRQRGKELWQQEYQEFYAVVGSGDSENIIREGTELLNNSSLQGYMKRNKEQKAEVLHAVGDGYFYSEQYDTAGKYYEEALSCDSRNSLYVRDYMTAMARNGSPVDVWTIQSEYPEAAIDEAATVFVQAQSMYAKGDQKSAVSLCEEGGGDDRQTADELGDQAEFQQVMRLQLVEQHAAVPILLGGHVAAEADALAVGAGLDDLLDAVEGAAADEQDVGGIHLQELLMGVLASALGGHVGHGAFQDLQQCLLDTLARDVPGDGGVLALPGDLVDLVHVDDAPLSQLNVVVGGLHQAQQDVLHVVAHVTGFGQRGGVGDGEGDLQDTRQGLGDEGLAAAGGAKEQDIALLQFHIVSAAEEDALIVVVDSHGEGHFCLVLADDVLVQDGTDVLGGGDLLLHFRRSVAIIGLLGLGNDTVAQGDTLVTNVASGSCDDALHLFLHFSAKGAADCSAFFILCHSSSLILTLRERAETGFQFQSPLSLFPYR